MPKVRRTTKAHIKEKQKTFTRFMSVFIEEIELKAFECNKAIAKALAEEAREVIKGQRYNWRPLSERYLQDKLMRGYDPRIYIRSEEFLKSISWGVTHGKVWTGIPSRIMHTGKFERSDEPDRSPIPMRWLARWLEYGATQRRKSSSGRIFTIILPPRPIWRPLMAKFVRFKPDFGKRYRKALDAAVKRRTSKI